MPNPATRIRDVARIARDDVEVDVGNGLSGGLSGIESDVVTVGFAGEGRGGGRFSKLVGGVQLVGRMERGAPGKRPFLRAVRGCPPSKRKRPAQMRRQAGGAPGSKSPTTICAGISRIMRHHQ